MKFKQHNDGSCDIEFSWKERLTLFRKGKLHLSSEGFKHFGNTLVGMVVNWQLKFDEKIQNKLTLPNDKIEGK